MVSALIQRSYPYLIVSYFLTEEAIELCISEELFKEYYEVLNRKKFSKYPDFVQRSEMLLAQIESKASIFNPSNRLQLIKDPDDNRLLELCAESKAGFLITGNTRDFTMQRFKRTRIVSPAEYWGKYRP